jgi:hypothetical protein
MKYPKTIFFVIDSKMTSLVLVIICMFDTVHWSRWPGWEMYWMS